MGVSQRDAKYKSDDPGIPEEKNKCKYQTHRCSSKYLYNKAVAICQIELHFHELNMQKTNNLGKDHLCLTIFAFAESCTHATYWTELSYV